MQITHIIAWHDYETLSLCRSDRGCPFARLFLWLVPSACARAATKSLDGSQTVLIGYAGEAILTELWVSHQQQQGRHRHRAKPLNSPR